MKHVHPIFHSDKKLKKLMEKVGPMKPTEWKRPKNSFHALLRAIISQQVSVAAAASILKKFKTLFCGRMPSPQEVQKKTDAELRSAGLSGQKIKYVRDLALHFESKLVDPRRFKSMTNDEVIDVLTKVKGVGVWTAHMFLIFTLKRPDILPTLDLAIKKGFQVVYRLKESPTHEKMEKLAQKWRAHASLASLYMWKASEQWKK